MQQNSLALARVEEDRSMIAFDPKAQAMFAHERTLLHGIVYYANYLLDDLILVVVLVSNATTAGDPPLPNYKQFVLPHPS